MTRERTRFARFAIVGAGGFLVDGGLLQALVSGLDVDPLAARAVSFPLAVLFTWWLNRSFTFGVHNTGKRSALISAARYFLVSAAGTLVNLATYSILIVKIDAFQPIPVIPLAIASVVAMGFNYLGTRHYAFRRPRP